MHAIKYGVSSDDLEWHWKAGCEGSTYSADIHFTYTLVQFDRQQPASAWYSPRIEGHVFRGSA